MTREEKREAFTSLSKRDGIQTGTEFADALTVGDRVYWIPDDEGGTVLDVAADWITIAWDESGVEVYSWGSGAIERIESRAERFSCGSKR
jgi:hypothetical protein